MRLQMLDGIGASILLAASTLPVGCVPLPSGRADLQPFVAASGSYAVLDATKPKPAVCETCGGKGVVGDGRIEVPCPQCSTKAATPACGQCDGRGYIVRSDGGRVRCPCQPCESGQCPIR